VRNIFFMKYGAWFKISLCLDNQVDCKYDLLGGEQIEAGQDVLWIGLDWISLECVMFVNHERGLLSE
jgi:hypothetical protein